MDDRLDIILFGVTGLVGRHALRNLCKVLKEERLNLKWGVAARDETKIRNILENNHPSAVFLADMRDSKSLEEMVKNTKVLLNACGPLRLKGESVIEACLKYKTHYIDVSAEPNFIEKVELLYDKKAEENGIYIMNSCGIDSITYEMGVVFLENNFKGTVNSIETFFLSGGGGLGIPGPDYNSSTWNSVVDLMSNKNELEDIRRRKRRLELPRLTPKLNLKVIPFQPKVENGWAFPSFTSDLSVMRRTQDYIYRKRMKRPIQLENYYMFETFVHLIIFAFLGCLLSILTKFDVGRKLLLKYPDMFSMGVFGTVEPPQEKIGSDWFRLTLIGKGWKGQQSAEKVVGKPNTEMVVRVRGNNMAYGSTSLCLIMAGIMLITEKSVFPKKGGVYTPGVTLRDTSIISKLDKYGVKFEILSTKNKGD